MLQTGTSALRGAQKQEKAAKTVVLNFNVILTFAVLAIVMIVAGQVIDSNAMTLTGATISGFALVAFDELDRKGGKQ